MLKRDDFAVIMDRPAEIDRSGGGQSESCPQSCSKEDSVETFRQALGRNLVAVLVTVNLVVLLLGKSVLDNVLQLNADNSVWFSLAVHLTIVSTYSIWLRHNPVGAGNSDKCLLWLIAAFAIVVLSTVPACVSRQVEDVPTAIRHALLVIFPIVSYLYVCPRILKRRNYVSIFAVILFAFCVHALVSVGLCITDTTVIAGREIIRDVGRSPQFFGHYGMFVTGLYWHPNTLAMMLMLLPAMAAIVWESVSSRWAKVMAGIAMFLVSGHLILTFSRAAIASFLLSFSLWALFLQSRTRRTIFLSLAVIISVVIFLVQQAFNLNNDSSMLERLRFWNNEWTRIVPHPWGQGLPVFGMEYAPHSLVLGTLRYFGIQGMIALGLILGYALLRPVKNAARSPSSHLLLFVLAITVIFHGVFEYFIGHPMHVANSLFWLMLGYLNIAAGNEATSRTGTCETELVAIRSE